MDVDECVVTSVCGKFSRQVWFSEGPEEAHPLCVILDGEFYRDRMEILPILAQLRRDSALPKMSYLLVSYKSAEARQSDFLCDPAYARFIAEDLVTWAKARVSSIREGGHLLCGVSLSGLCGAFVTMKYPQVFSYSLCQSGSFWWNHEWFADQIRDAAPLSARFWLSVGDKESAENVSHPPSLFQEISQIAGVKKAASGLEEHGAEVMFTMYKGGHEAGPWKAEFSEALAWLLVAA